MKNFNYSIICEDKAHEIFIKEFLCHYKKENNAVDFEFNETCFKKFDTSTKTKLLHAYANIAERSFKIFGVNVLFIVVDYDKEDINNFQHYEKERIKELDKSIASNCIIAIPVKNIEFWLWHIKWKLENKGSTKNISIENRVGNEVKFEIYKRKKPDKDYTKEVVENIMQHFDKDWLISRSESFNRFNINFEKAINSISR